MENFKYLIEPSRLEGNVEISGAKNSSLRLLAASLLSNSRVILSNMPSEILDVKIHLEMLEKLGKKIHYDGSTIIIEEGVEGIQTELKWSKRSIRNTLLIAGALLARKGEAIVPLPGGCKLGDRKIDLHLLVFEKLGAEYLIKDDSLFLKTKKRLIGAEIYLPIRSTGATENALICGSLASGTTTIHNPHIRPEILDLISFLRKLGVKIEVFGQDHITIQGIDSSSRAISHFVIPDNVEAITWFILSILHRSYFEIDNFPLEHLTVPLQFLSEGKSFYSFKENRLCIKGAGATSFEIATGPYPGINSDMQPLFAAYGIFAQGRSIIHDLRFQDRFTYIEELSKLGAKINRSGHTIEIFGNQKLSPNKVTATDLRGGMALSIVASLANGTSEIIDAFQIERGYDRFTEKFNSLGGKVRKVKYEEN